MTNDLIIVPSWDSQKIKVLIYGEVTRTFYKRIRKFGVKKIVYDKKTNKISYYELFSMKHMRDKFFGDDLFFVKISDELKNVLLNCKNVDNISEKFINLEIIDFAANISFFFSKRSIAEDDFYHEKYTVHILNIREEIISYLESRSKEYYERIQSSVENINKLIVELKSLYQEKSSCKSLEEYCESKAKYLLELNIDKYLNNKNKELKIKAKHLINKQLIKNVNRRKKLQRHILATSFFKKYKKKEEA